MNMILDFIRAAIPWIIMGIVVILLIVCHGTRKNKEKKSENDYSLEGMCLGMCFGTMIMGVAFGSNAEIGCSLGMLIGFVIGLCIKKKSMKAGDVK